MSTKEVARFTDRYGEERIVHRTHSGLRVKNNSLTPALKMNQAVSLMIGRRIRFYRERNGWTLEELAVRAGMASGNPKQRIWAIENALRGQGMRMGTVYALAAALGVEATDLMPSVADVATAAEVRSIALTPAVLAVEDSAPGLAATPKADERSISANGPSGASPEGNDGGTGVEMVVHNDRFGVWTMRPGDEVPQLRYRMPA
jgi:transcriptional regulator with XRE-family HTH domain